MPATFKGANTLTKKQKLSYSTDGVITGSITYEGVQADLTTARPGVGDAVTILAASLVVTSVEFETAANGPFCSMTVNASNATASSGTAQDTIWELDYQRVDKDIKTHRAWYTGGSFAMSSADWASVTAWEADTDAITKDQKFQALSNNAIQLAGRLRRGETTYPIWVPVARVTEERGSRPTTSSVGSIESPPSQCGAPSNTAAGKPYIYVLMSDKATRSQGKPWRREREWMGFDAVDRLIYENE